jgi:hypothetical protein
MSTESPTGGAARANFNVSSINRNDLGVLIAGVVAFIASFLPYYGYKFKGVTVSGVHIGGSSASVTAWHSYAVLGLLLIFAAAILVAVKTFASLPTMPVGVYFLAGVLAAVGTFLVILRAYTAPSASGPGGSVGVRWGAYVLFIAGIVEAVFAFLAMRESGERVPWQSGSPAGSPGAPAA